MSQQFRYSQEILDAVMVFANSIDTSFYATRNQLNNEKRKRDQIIGKLGEFAVKELLANKYPDLSDPDLKIYSARKKSWAFDLSSSSINLHVKSQDIIQGSKYGVSWIFQVGDKEVFNPSTESSVAFTSVNLSAGTVDLLGVVKVSTLHDQKLFKLPKLEYLQKMNKLAVYYDDLKKLTHEQLWT
jgi:hypothetical protein